jgi:hypothetical protein
MKYEAPEMFELGDAGELTQASVCGLVLDADGFPRFKCRPNQLTGTEAPTGDEAEPARE